MELPCGEGKGEGKEDEHKEQEGQEDSSGPEHRPATVEHMLVADNNRQAYINWQVNYSNDELYGRAGRHLAPLPTRWLLNIIGTGLDTEVAAVYRRSRHRRDQQGWKHTHQLARTSSI